MEDVLPPRVLPACEIAHEPVHAKSSTPQSSVPPQSGASPPVWIKTKTNKTGLTAPEKPDAFTNPYKSDEGTVPPAHVPTGSKETTKVTRAPHPVVCMQRASFQLAEVFVSVRHSVAGPVQQEVPGTALPLLSDLVQVGIQSKIPPFSAAEMIHNNVNYFSHKEHQIIDSQLQHMTELV